MEIHEQGEEFHLNSQQRENSKDLNYSWVYVQKFEPTDFFN